MNEIRLNYDYDDNIEYVISENNDKVYFKKGTNIIHRLDGPAIEYSDGDKAWYQNDKLHRINGPARESIHGKKEWFQNHKLHRTDGPAVEYLNEIKQYWINGEYIAFSGTDEEWIIKNLLE